MKTFFQRIALWVLAACMLACAGMARWLQQRVPSGVPGHD